MIVTGESAASGPLAPLRKSLWPFAWLYAGVAATRNGLYSSGWKRVHRLSVPVLSVGNLTVGGTGKTPLVVWLIEALLARGFRPGVLARGYRRAAGARLNDEGEMLARRFPGLPQVQDPDRVAGGARLLAEHELDLVVLDDGFQHRRLGRERDIVCLDARLPFDNWQTLPAGLLREPPRGLRRADVAVLTRADRIDDEGFAARRARIHALAGRAIPVLRAVHEAAELVERPSGASRPLGAVRGQRVGLMSAIGNAASFERTVEQVGGIVAWHERFRDHHRFRPEELARVGRRAAADSVPLLVTEKDDVKLPAADLPRLVLRIAMRFGGEDPLADLVGDILGAIEPPVCGGALAPGAASGDDDLADRDGVREADA